MLFVPCRYTDPALLPYLGRDAWRRGPALAHSSWWHAMRPVSSGLSSAPPVRVLQVFATQNR